MSFHYTFIDPRKQHLNAKLETVVSKLEILILDVDGILTDGTVWWVEGTGWTRAFNVRDGHGLKLLRNIGMDIAFVSGGDSKSVRERAKFLNIKHVYLGDENKIVALEKILKDTGLKPEQCAYMGDDLFDIPVLERVGFSATVPNAVPEVKEIVHYITHEVGGLGAAREVCDLIRRVKSQSLQPGA